MLEIAGVKPAKGQVTDGESLVPLLKQTGKLHRDAIYWHYPHYHPGGATPHSAIRQGDWKLVRQNPRQTVQLFDLKSDPKELKDLAADKPEVVKRLEPLFRSARVDHPQFPTKPAPLRGTPK